MWINWNVGIGLSILNIVDCTSSNPDDTCAGNRIIGLIVMARCNV